MLNRILALVLLTAPLAGVWGDYPLISYTIKSLDPLYSQQQEDVELWYSGTDETLPLAIYRYIPRPSDDLFSIAAAFNLPYEAVATLNGWDSPGLLNPGSDVLIPNKPGIFVPEKPLGIWERVLSSSGREGEPVSVRVRLDDSITRTYIFYPGSKFTPEERVKFLGSLFSSPLSDGKITSGFGYRLSPVTGMTEFHPGVDMRAPPGTPVTAARSGTVTSLGTLEIYGYFIILGHDGGYETVYAHLDEILVGTGDVVNAGDLIAASGNTGVSTGPHLHFEIRRNGVPIDPSRLTSFYD